MQNLIVITLTLLHVPIYVSMRNLSLNIYSICAEVNLRQVLVVHSTAEGYMHWDGKVTSYLSFNCACSLLCVEK
jgi:hypothetical protein